MGLVLGCKRGPCCEEQKGFPWVIGALAKQIGFLFPKELPTLMLPSPDFVGFFYCG